MKTKVSAHLKEFLKTSKNYYHDSYITIDHIPERNWLYVDWTGYQTEESIMNGGMKMLEALRLFGVSKVLNDNTHVVGIWTPAAKWAGEVWFPDMLSAGLKYFAWIYSPSRLSQVSTDATLDNTKETNNIKTFYDIDKAVLWLEHSPSE